MAWINVDDQAIDHPKLARLTDRAFRLWFAGLSYAQRFLTDGILEMGIVPSLRGYSAKTVAELVTGALWEPCEGGYAIHDFLDWNESKAEVSKRRQRKADRMASWRQKKEKPRDAPRDALQSGTRDAPRALSHNHNHSVAKATHTAPMPARRALHVLNEGDTVPFPSALVSEFQPIIAAKSGDDGYSALLSWVHRISDSALEQCGGCPREAIGKGAFDWWRGELARDFGAVARPVVKACRHGHQPPCQDDVACTKRYLDGLQNGAA